MNQDQFLGLLRDFLKVVGTALAIYGIGSSDWALWSGIIMTLAPMLWSVYERTRDRMVAKVDALPEVAGVVTKDTPEGHELAAVVPSRTVVPAGTIAAATLANGAPR